MGGELKLLNPNHKTHLGENTEDGFRLREEQEAEYQDSNPFVYSEKRSFAIDNPPPQPFPNPKPQTLYLKP